MDNRARKLAKQLKPTLGIAMRDAHTLAAQITTDARTALKYRDDKHTDGTLCAVLPLPDNHWQLILLRGNTTDISWLTRTDETVRSGPVPVGRPFTPPDADDIDQHLRIVTTLAGGRYEPSNGEAVAHLRIPTVGTEDRAVLPHLGQPVRRATDAEARTLTASLSQVLRQHETATGLQWCCTAPEDLLEEWTEDVLGPACRQLADEAPDLLAILLRDGAADLADDVYEGLASPERTGWSLPDLCGGLSPRMRWPDLLLQAIACSQCGTTPLQHD